MRERLGEQLLEVEHLDAAVGERVGERVVLLAGALDPEDVVEQQRVLVAGRQALELEVGPVEDDTPQRADLRPDVEPRSDSARIAATDRLDLRGHRPAPAASGARACGAPTSASRCRPGCRPAAGRSPW